MRRTARISVATLLLAALAGPDAAPRAQGVPPHASLFGSWTGGLFPAPTELTAQTCLAHPVVIFTEDLVLRATLTDTDFVQRLILTARTTPRGFDIRFSPSRPQAAAGFMGIASGSGAAGFGCESPDLLHVERHGSNEITFPGCADFPNPLVRCPGA